MLHISKIQAISLDLDDTLWPIWPVIARAEKALIQWLHEHAPMTAAMFSSPSALQDIRQHMHEVMLKHRPELAHDLGAIRKESIRLALYRANENPLLAEPAYEVFAAERNRVELYEDSLDALKALSARYPLVAISNGNAQIDRVGIAHYFQAHVTAAATGVSKPARKIFFEGAAAVGCAPEALLHIGDDAALDVLGALDAGMQAVWLNRQGKLWPHEIVEPSLEVASLAECVAALGL